MDTTSLAPLPSQVLALASGRSIEVTEGASEDRLEVRSTRGDVVLTLRLTDEGPVLSLSGVSLELTASTTLAIACETLAIKATSDASIEVGGNLRERVGGDATREAAGKATLAAREVKVDAFPGGIVLKANDDVAVTGERVRLNSDDPPMPLTWEEHRARRALAAGHPAQEEGVVAALRGAPPGVPEP
jgi:hypothetical protein